MVRDTGDAAQRVVGFGLCGVHLADELVLGPLNVRQRSHRGAHPCPAAVDTHRSELSRRIRQPQFRCVGEQFDDVFETSVVDGRPVQMDQVGERQPVGDRDPHALSAKRGAQADNRSFVSASGMGEW
jgi:hypothetical protein